MALSRRIFLGGAGAMVGLPMLETFAPRQAKAGGLGGAPKRLLTFYLPCGIHMASWTPAQTGSNFTLPLILEPLAPVQDNILVLSGLDNTPGQPEGPGDHAGGTSAFLTCTHVTKSETQITNATSVDQVYAAQAAAETVLPSMQLGIDGGGNTGNCDSGYGCAYSRNISWNGNTPLPKITSTSTAFDLLFAGFDPGASIEELARRKAGRLSVLDYVLQDAQSLQMKLSTSDKNKVQQYLDSVRELELKIEAEDEAGSCELEGNPGEPADLQNHVQLMCDLMVKAFECDRTRVLSFMLGNAGNNRDYPFLGVNAGHHNLSHHDNNPDNFAMLEIIDRWEVEQLAYLLQQMAATPDGPDTTLLDNSMVFFSSEIEDGNSHGHRGLPTIVAGGGGGTINSGRHLDFGGQPMANLFLTMLQGLDVDINSFGDNSTGPLAL
ncbi:MAG: DUF1552 domain-containing protein [Nannocystaceae bacterium]|nr:DUF1552 domain-containing protein [Nannocystaceae bacterium]